jgi:hypothetical protein
MALIRCSVTPRMFRRRAGSSESVLEPVLIYSQGSSLFLSLSFFFLFQTEPSGARSRQCPSHLRPPFVDPFRKDLHSHIPYLLHTSSCLAQALPRRNRPLHRRSPWKLRPELQPPSISFLRPSCLDSSREHIP